MNLTTIKNRKIGILIIHGIGEQNVYETLDLFTRNLVDSLRQSRPDDEITLTHSRAQLAEGTEDYVEVCCSHDPTVRLDVHEYYWAHNMKDVISFQEIFQWLIQASDGAEKFYDDNNELVRRYEAFEDGKFKKRWYLKHLGWVLRGLYKMGVVTHGFMPSFLDPIIRLFIGKPTQLLIDYLGDVAIYTSSDMKSKFYEVRQRVLQGAIQKITSLLDDDYEKIILVGHSLGSVIAYDALNRINLTMNDNEALRRHADKLTDFISIGSPLDKVAFFFREHIPQSDYVKRLVLNNVNAFRRIDTELPASPDLVFQSTVRDCLTSLNWTNYWDPKDPISGPLDFYKGVTNIQVDNGQKWGYAHVGYWQNMRIFQDAVKQARIPYNGNWLPLAEQTS